MIIDAKNKIVGRIATYAAKQALLGNKVDVVNCRDAVITGSKKKILANYQRKRIMGTPTTGPFHHRTADRFVKRIIRGMLPKHKTRGYDALARVKCYNTLPKQFEGKEFVTLKQADVAKTTTTHVSVSTIVKHLGGKA